MSNGNDELIKASDVADALQLLTRLPVPQMAGQGRGAKAAWAYPVAGAIVGFLAACAGGIALWLGLAPYLAAALAVATMVILTGAMHEDGLADSADGLWGGWDKERRLEIMKDSRIGSYGVLALGLSLILRVSALGVLFSAGHVFAPLILAGALSRSGMPPIMAMVEPARSTGLAADTGRPSAPTALLAVGIGTGFALVFAGGAGLPALLVAGLAFWAAASVAAAKIGGHTGDTLGAAQQLGEIAVLLSLSAALG